jgi:ribosomal protein L35AE/L33A
VELNGYSNSLVTDGDDAEFASGSNYSFSDSSGGMDVEFAPAEKQGREGTAGTVEYRFFRNLPAPTTGSVTVIVSVYLPYFDLKIHSFTQELTFRITEP